MCHGMNVLNIPALKFTAAKIITKIIISILAIDVAINASLRSQASADREVI